MRDAASPKTKANGKPKTVSGVSAAAKQYAIRQMIAKKEADEAEPSMQEIEHAAEHTQDAAQAVFQDVHAITHNATVQAPESTVFRGVQAISGDSPPSAPSYPSYPSFPKPSSQQPVETTHEVSGPLRMESANVYSGPPLDRSGLPIKERPISTDTPVIKERADGFIPEPRQKATDSIKSREVDSFQQMKTPETRSAAAVFPQRTPVAQPRPQLRAQNTEQRKLPVQIESKAESVQQPEVPQIAYTEAPQLYHTSEPLILERPVTADTAPDIKERAEGYIPKPKQQSLDAIRQRATDPTQQIKTSENSSTASDLPQPIRAAARRSVERNERKTQPLDTKPNVQSFVASEPTDAPKTAVQAQVYAQEPRLREEQPIKLRETAETPEIRTIETPAGFQAKSEHFHVSSNDAPPSQKKRAMRSSLIKHQERRKLSEPPGIHAMTGQPTARDSNVLVPTKAGRQDAPIRMDAAPVEEHSPEIRTRSNLTLKAIEKDTRPNPFPAEAVVSEQKPEGIRLRTKHAEIKTPKRSLIKTADSATQPKTRFFNLPTRSKAKASTERGRKQFERDARRKLAAQAKQAAKKAAEAAEKTAAAAAQAIKSAFSALAAGGAGAVLLAVLLLVGIVAAIASSPFGIFFADGGEDTATLAAAIAQINGEYCDVLEELQSGDYDEIIVDGEPPDWVEVVAIFACATASDGENAMDVATLDEARVQKLRETFWAMCEITTEEATTEPETEEATEPEDGDETEETEEAEGTTTLFIHIHSKTADEMRAELHFSDYQNAVLDSLLEERESLQSLIGALTISDETAAELWHNLPADLSIERKQVIRHALSLVGKVNYFWGGKSLVLGWDPRWGQLTLVTAEGSQTTGTYRPYGLDCSGFVDWVFYNASNGEYVLGHGGGAASQRAYCTDISWAEAQPGDLVFYFDNSHVGIVGGRDENGNLQIIHCNAGANNVSISGASGFSSVARPVIY